MKSEKMTLAQLVDILSLLWKMLLGNEVGYDSVSCETAQAILKGDRQSFASRFVKFLASGGRFVLGSLKVVCAPFDPVKFLGTGWSVVPEDQDKDSAALKEVEFTTAEFVSCLQESEPSIKGEEKLARLKAIGRIPYGATVFMGLWLNYQSCGDKTESIIEKLYQAGVIGSYIDFFGDVLLYPDGRRIVLCLCRVGDGSWHWYYFCLGGDWDVQGLSAVSQQVSK
ncbi:MAG: hypothetical protein NTY04_02605 [Candidatus Staskawiczbacteria bacterium]|nr:hypothetical protein [Candidatus Staskawiczbacteria bacterium]